MKFLALFLLTTLFPLNSCSLRKKNINQQKNGHYSLYSLPENINFNEKDGYKLLVLSITNNLSGDLEGSNEEVLDLTTKTYEKVKVGGLNALEAYFNILKPKIKNKNLLIDLGNTLHQSENHSKTLTNLEILGYDLVNLGENEFNLIHQNKIKDLEYLSVLYAKRKFKTLIGNVYSIERADLFRTSSVMPYTIITVNGLKVGILNLIDPSFIKSEYTLKNKLYVKPIFESLIKTIQILRSKNSDIIIANINTPFDCTEALSHRHNLPYDKVNFEQDISEICNKDSDIYKILETLPKNTIDVVLTGDKNSKINNFINGTPVIRPLSDGKSFSLVEIHYDIKSKSIDHNLTKIYDPIRLCHSFIKETNDCYTKEPVKSFKEVEARFLGEKVLINTHTLK